MSEVRDIRKEVIDLKESLPFSQKDIKEGEVSIKNWRLPRSLETSTKPTRILKTCMIVMNTSKKNSRRNNIKVFGFRKRQRLRAQSSGKSVKLPWKIKFVWAEYRERRMPKYDDRAGSLGQEVTCPLLPSCQWHKGKILSQTHCGKVSQLERQGKSVASGKITEARWCTVSWRH